jgi:hypothetical protein
MKHLYTFSGLLFQKHTIKKPRLQNLVGFHAALFDNSILIVRCFLFSVALALMLGRAWALDKPDAPEERFEGAYYRGTGDAEYLQLLDIAHRMLAPDPEFQNLAMLYSPVWNGLTEGPTWNAWWVQNSYGTTYCALPFLEEPFTTFLQNANDLWFNQMGDGKRKGANDWVAPDGCLCDAAGPGYIYYRQGDGRTEIHDWAVEYTAAGLLMQSEILLIDRNITAIARYLPKLERCAEFLETRRDTKNNLMLAGPAANLLGPSYAGYHKPDGSYGMAYLTGLSVTTIAALDRLIEVEKLYGKLDRAALYTQRRDALKKGLVLLTQPDGTLIRSLDPDGTRHGVYGAAKYGYFETPPNHDAIAFHVVDDKQAERIYDKITSIQELRPYQFILPNYPSYDDMYEKPQGLWSYGTWVNGGHWSSCEARMILAYYRLGKTEETRKSMLMLLAFARLFRLDNPLSKMGRAVYQPNQPINLTYDAFGPPTALLRGLFEYLYTADSLILIPHVPPSITSLEQFAPVRYGVKRLELATFGKGPITGVQINGMEWRKFDARTVTLPYDQLPDTAYVRIILGKAKLAEQTAPRLPVPTWLTRAEKYIYPDLANLEARAVRLRRFYALLAKTELFDTYEAAHTRLALQAIATVYARRRLLAEEKINKLANSNSQQAADQSYLDAANRLCDGLETALNKDKEASDARRSGVYRAWLASAAT